MISLSNTRLEEEDQPSQHSTHRTVQSSVLAGPSNAVWKEDLVLLPVEPVPAKPESIPCALPSEASELNDAKSKPSKPSSKRPQVRKSMSPAIRSLRAISKMPQQISIDRGPQNSQDTPAMITLRQASLSSSLRETKSNHQELGFGPSMSIRQAIGPSKRVANTKITIHPLLKAARTKKPNRKSGAETALTLVHAYAKLTGAEDATSNMAERRGSTVAVIVTEQGSHEIIWRYDDTPSSYSSSSSGRQSYTSGVIVKSRPAVETYG